MKRLNAAFVVLFTFIVTNNGFAEELEKDSTIHQLKKIVITATKRSRSVSDLPVSATIIDKDDIRLSAAKSIDDLLQYASGVQVKRAVGMGEGVPSDIIMRGIPGALAATRTLILVDGIPTNVSGTPFLILNEIPLEAIERIEIIRGPFSSLYGANAFGGVINIITIVGDGKPSLKLTGETSYPFTSAHNYGVEGRETGSDFWKENAKLTYWNGSAVFGAGNENVDLLAVGGVRTIGNYFLKDSALVRKGYAKRNKDISNHDYTDNRLLLKSNWHISDQLKNTVHLRLFSSELGFGKTGTDPNADVIIEGKKALIGDYLEFSPLDNLHLKVGGFFRVVDGDYADKADSLDVSGYSIIPTRTVPTQWDAHSRDVQGEGSVVFIPTSTHTIISGFDILHNLIQFGALKYRSSDEVRSGETDVKRTFWNVGMFIQDDITLNGVNVIPAIRGDYHSKFGWMLSPKLGVSSRLFDRFTARASAGTAFRAPSTTELYGNVIVGAVKVYGNPELKPERVIAFDGGFEVDIYSGITATSSFFYNNMSRLITLSLDRSTFDMALENAPLEVTHGNIESAYSWGIENEITIDRFKPVNIMFNYTFTQSNNETTDKTLDYIPTHKAGAEAGVTQKLGNGRISFSVKEGFVGSRSYLDWSTKPNVELRLGGIRYIYNYVTLDPYWHTDFSLSYTFKNNHDISITAQNCFDAEIEESGGTYSPGRFFSLKYSAPITF